MGKNEAAEIIQLVSFRVEKEEFGVDILKVQEINRMVEITSIPNSPDFIDGVINLRGRVIPVISLRKRLGLGRIEYDRHTRIIVVEIREKVIGFIVDSVSEVLRIPRSITEKPPVLAAGINSEFITAIGKLEDRMLILLDLEMTLLDKEKEELLSIHTTGQ